MDGDAQSDDQRKGVRDPGYCAHSAEFPTRWPLTPPMHHERGNRERLDAVEFVREHGDKPVEPVRLWREVDALGGSREGEFAEGYGQALDHVLAILEQRGFTEHVDPLDRLARIEASAEVLIVARHDLMVEVDQATASLRDPAAYLDVASIAQLLDRLAAYMKGQDDRVVALGDKLEHQARELASARLASREAGDLLRESLPAVRLVDTWARWSDASLQAFVDTHLAKREWGDIHRDAVASAYFRGMRATGFAILDEVRSVAQFKLGADAVDSSRRANA